MADLNLLGNALDELKEQLLFLDDSKYKACLIHVLNDFYDYAATGEENLHQKLLDYYQETLSVRPFEKPSTVYLRRKARILQMLNDVINGRRPKRKYCYGNSVIPSVYEHEATVYSDWMTRQGKSSGTISSRMGRIKVFFIFLADNGCREIESINPNLMVQFITQLSGKYSSQGKANILYTLRNFFSSPEISCRLACDPMPLLSQLHSHKHERLASCYSTTEIRDVMAAVDRSTKPGKTDYLMMILACVYGLRVSDIRELRFSSINWKKNTITLHQYKTKRYVKFPMIEAVILALLDYIKNVRPSSDDPHVFIKHRSPHEPYAQNDHFSYRISRYFVMAGVNTVNKHHGLHSMRHSLATELIADEFPVNEVATIMGHTTIASTNTYIWSDIRHLKIAALEVPGYDK